VKRVVSLSSAGNRMRITVTINYDGLVYTYDFEESQEIIQETEENIDYLKLLVEDD
jgi:hypothetical protein